MICHRNPSGRDTLIDCQKKFHPLQSGKVERGCGHFFTKVQKGYRVIKLYVRNFVKMMELSDLFVPAGSRTLFELNFLQFFQESCKGESHFL